MSYQLAWRKSGKYVAKGPLADEKAKILYDEIFSQGYSYVVQSHGRWNWVRDTLARWCLLKAEWASAAEADIWIERYKSIRGIK